MNNILKIDPSLETRKITSFIKTVLKREGFKKVVIGMSGGVDSTTAFYLLKEVVAPENIFVAHLYYLDSQFRDIEGVIRNAGIPKENIYEMSISPLVEAFVSCHPEPCPELVSWIGSGSPSPQPSPLRRGRKKNPLSPWESPKSSLSPWENPKSPLSPWERARVRVGNIMARIRTIILYDLAKKHNALVCGTENKSEFLLGYFTRFGDQASDFEPIQHLYKTQIYQLANFLNVPKNIIKKTPTAGLWRSQTDEKEFGFSYKEGDQVLFYYYDKKLNLEEIKSMGFKNAKKIVSFSLKNSYKHLTPYILGSTNNNPNTKNH